MNAIITNKMGEIRFSHDVLARLAGYAANCCYGVVGMAVKTGKDGIARLLKKETMSRGVKVAVTEAGLSVDLYIMVEYGINIGTIAQSIKNNVKYQVETATGLEVANINVHVESIRTE